MVFETALLFKNADGLPDLRRETYAARQWMTSLLDAAGLVAPPRSPLEVREAVKKERQSLLQSVREAISPVRVEYVRALGGRPDELAATFPEMATPDDVFAYYKIIPKAQREVRSANYQRRAAQQVLGAAMFNGDPIQPADCRRAVDGLHTLAEALSPASFAELDRDSLDGLRETLRETAAVLLDLDNKLG
ncbi:hypothetical protein [Kitasatospora sp. NPDC088134]|uniref:hypothetical protein n=1 Tax=Kitasatospora sp. NPDC088134 TaxID=3364071 RepID=UPI003809734A